MGDDLAEYMTYLRGNVSDLKKLGKEWGMSESDIMECIDGVLKKAKKKNLNSWKNVARRMWSYIRFLIKIPLYLLLVIACLAIGFTVVTTYSDTAEKYANKALQPYGYTIFRVLRLATLPIHSVWNISAYYTSECIIPNPMFKDEVPPECYPCMEFKSVKRFNTSEFAPGKLYSYMEYMRPVLFKDSLTNNITYKDLRNLYIENTEELEAGLLEFETNEPTLANSLHDLFHEDKETALQASNAVKIVWASSGEETNDVLIKLFPRPKFLPKGFAEDPERNIFIGGPKTKKHSLPQFKSTAQIYTQVAGKRSLLILPVAQCGPRCNTLMISLDPGSSLAFNNELWEVQVLASGDELSIGYHTAFHMV